MWVGRVGPITPTFAPKQTQTNKNGLQPEADHSNNSSQACHSPFFTLQPAHKKCHLAFLATKMWSGKQQARVALKRCTGPSKSGGKGGASAWRLSVTGHPPPSHPRMDGPSRSTCRTGAPPFPTSPQLPPAQRSRWFPKRGSGEGGLKARSQTAGVRDRPVVRSGRARLRMLTFDGCARLRTSTPQHSARLCTLGPRGHRGGPPA